MAAEIYLELTPEHVQLWLLSRYIFEKASASLDPLVYMSAGLSVSLCQDAAEMAARTIAKDVQASLSEKTTFPALWDLVEKSPRSAGKQLPSRGHMEDVNKARRNFKHYGQVPRKEDAERFISYTEAFLNNALKEFYGREFSSISLVDLISRKDVADRLRRAEACLQEENYKGCIEECAQAAHHSAQILERLLPRLERLRPPIGGRDHELQHSVGQLMSVLGAHLEAHRAVIYSLLLRIPSADLIRFRSLTPRVLVFGDGRAQLVYQGYPGEPTYDDAKFCLTHAVDVALRAEEIVRPSELTRR